MNKDEMIKDKEQMARIIAFDLCPQKRHKELWGEEAKCYADNNFGDCIKIKEVVDKSYNAGYRKVGEDEIVVKKRQYEQLKKYNRDRKRLRLKWQQAKQDLDDIYSNGFVLLVEHHEIVDQVARETRQKTAREILALIGKPNYKGDDWYEGAFFKQEQIREQIADIYGIELE